MLVFVYGTLTDPDRVDAVVDDWSFEGDAVLEGLVRVAGQYPTLVPPSSAAASATASAAGDALGPSVAGRTHGTPHVEGRLLRTPDVEALDAYEGVDRALYARVTVPVEGRESGCRERHGAAAVYVGDPARLEADGTWPGPDSFPERVRRYVGEHDVVVRPAGGR